MISENVHQFGDWFEVMTETSRSQVAMMRLNPGQASGENPESHPHSDQILLVLEGEVEGEIGGERRVLKKGEFVLVVAGTLHRFVNKGQKTALTFNVYAPPAYK